MVPTAQLPRSNPENNGPESKPKRTRRSAPKSRRGCRTCKIRHEKCDEKRPSCTQCTNTSRTCDFIETNPISSKTLTRWDQQNAVVAQPCKALVSEASFEVQNLDYFRNVCTKSFCEFAKDGIWQNIVLQQILTQDCVRYGAAAVAALHRALAFPDLRTISPTGTSIQKNAFANYTKAVKLLMKSLANDSATCELACVASVLFMSFEVFRGNDSGAVIHIEAGTRILKSISSSSCTGKISDNFNHIMRTFSRIDIQASTFSTDYVAKVLIPPVVPNRFSDLLEAREVLDAIVALMFSFIFPDPHLIQAPHKSLPEIPLPQYLAEHVAHIVDLLGSWSFKFEPFAAINSIRFTPQDHIGATILRISHLTAWIFNQTYYNSLQTSYDQYNPRFLHILELATAVIESSAGIIGHGGLRVVFDIGIIQPLYFLTLRCRDHSIRIRAITLLEKSGREGVWDGMSMAAIARFVMKKEEEGLSICHEDQNTSNKIPEEKRLHRIWLQFFRLERRVTIKAARKRSGGDWELIEGETECWGPVSEVGDQELASVETLFD